CRNGTARLQLALQYLQNFVERDEVVILAHPVQMTFQHLDAGELRGDRLARAVSEVLDHPVITENQGRLTEATASSEHALEAADMQRRCAAGLDTGAQALLQHGPG